MKAKTIPPECQAPPAEGLLSPGDGMREAHHIPAGHPSSTERSSSPFVRARLALGYSGRTRLALPHACLPASRGANDMTAGVVRRPRRKALRGLPDPAPGTQGRTQDEWRKRERQDRPLCLPELLLGLQSGPPTLEERDQHGSQEFSNRPGKGREHKCPPRSEQ